MLSQRFSLTIQAVFQNFYGVEDKPDEDVVAAADNDVVSVPTTFLIPTASLDENRAVKGTCS